MLLIILCAAVFLALSVQWAADPATLSSHTNILRRRYLDPLGPLFYSGTVLLDKLPKQARGAGANRRAGLKAKNRNGAGPGGRGYGVEITWDIDVADNDSFGSRAAHHSATTGYLPEAGHAAAVEAAINAAHYFGVVEIDGALVDANVPAEDMVNVLDREVNSLFRGGRRGLNIDLYGDGKGSLAAVTASTSSTTVYVSDWRYLMDRRNKRICIAVEADGTGALERTMSEVSKVYDATHSGYPVTITVAATVDATMRIYRPGIHNTSYASSRNNALSGLGLIVSASSTYAGLDRSQAANAGARSYVPAAIAEDDWAPDALEDLIDAVQDAGAKPTLIVCGRKFWKKFGQAMYGFQTWQNAVKRIDGGYPALHYNDMPLVKDRDCPDWKAFPIDPNQLTLGVERELGLWDLDGQTWVRTTETGGGKDAIAATIVTRCNLLARNPAGLGVQEITPNT